MKMNSASSATSCACSAATVVADVALLVEHRRQRADKDAAGPGLDTSASLAPSAFRLTIGGSAATASWR